MGAGKATDMAKYSIKPLFGTQRDDTRLGKWVVEQSNLGVMFVEKEMWALAVGLVGSWEAKEPGGRGAGCWGAGG